LTQVGHCEQHVISSSALAVQLACGIVCLGDVALAPPQLAVTGCPHFPCLA